MKKATMEEKKNKAIELLHKLGIYKPYIEGFEKENKVCFFEQFGGYWVYQEPEIEQKMREIESNYNCKVYAVTHEITNIGDCWDFLLVTDYPTEWDGLVYELGANKYGAFAYVWNKDDDWCSEFGSIAIQSFGGGLRRIG